MRTTRSSSRPGGLHQAPHHPPRTRHPLGAELPGPGTPLDQAPQEQTPPDQAYTPRPEQTPPPEQTPGPGTPFREQTPPPVDRQTPVKT